MEFAEFIKTPKLDKVILHDTNQTKIECKLTQGSNCHILHCFNYSLHNLM